jgi:hypothetical protein
MRTGDATEWTFAVPSRRRPQYLIVAIANDLVTLPGTRRQDLASFAIAVAHPERFDAVWVSRGQRAQRLLRRMNTCLADEILI